MWIHYSFQFLISDSNDVAVQNRSLDVGEFVDENQDPFTNVELETIDDLKELKDVLKNMGKELSVLPLRVYYLFIGYAWEKDNSRSNTCYTVSAVLTCSAVSTSHFAFFNNCRRGIEFSLRYLI